MACSYLSVHVVNVYITFNLSKSYVISLGGHKHVCDHFAKTDIITGII